MVFYVPWIDWDCRFCPEWIRGSNEDESTIKAFLDLSAHGVAIPTAWCTHSDVDAVRLIGILNEHGYSVPHDVSVIGFDNLEISSLVHPQISTIGFDVKKQAGSIVAQLLENVERVHRGEPRDESIAKILTPPHLIERKSVSKPKVKSKTVKLMPLTFNCRVYAQAVSLQLLIELFNNGRSQT